MDFEQILVDRRDDVLILTLNRPEKLNAWTPKMSAELSAAIIDANDDDEIGAMVITGAGRGFCAGADISGQFAANLDARQEDRGQTAERESAPTRGEARGPDWITLCRQSKPLVAAINGPCIGVGLTMVLPFDQLLAAEGARLSLRFVKMGLVPELASSHFLVTRCGWGAASWLALSGTTVFADEALRLRLVDRVVPPDTLLDEAVAVAGRARQQPGAAGADDQRTAHHERHRGGPGRGATARDRCHPGRLPLARTSRGGHGLHGKARAELPPGGLRILSVRPPVRGSTRTIVVPTVTPPEKVDEGPRSRIEPLVVGDPGPQLSRIDPTIELGAGLTVAVVIVEDQKTLHTHAVVDEQPGHSPRARDRGWRCRKG